MAFQTPVLFLLFNRPDHTKQVFEQIRKAQPAKLFVAADGPRPGIPDEAEKCRAVRAVVQKIDWSCEVSTLFRDTNLGCRNAVAQAIDWFFEHVEQGVIIEDDCVPGASFFRYAEELLHFYKDDERIMHICGANFVQNLPPSDGTYYFSQIMYCWGWATWKRAWKKFDRDMKKFPLFIKQRLLDSVFPEKIHAQYYENMLERTYRRELDTWDYVWQFSIWAENGLCINPKRNLVTNIGFGEDAAHTTQKVHAMANLPAYEIEEIIHPSFMIVDPRNEYSILEVCCNISLGRRERLSKKLGSFLLHPVFDLPSKLLRALPKIFAVKRPYQ